jgi:hypothetical protein
MEIIATDNLYQKTMRFSLHHYHILCIREADGHPSLCISLHVDVQEPGVTSVGVNTYVEITYWRIAAGWVMDPQAIIKRGFVL